MKNKIKNDKLRTYTLEEITKFFHKNIMKTLPELLSGYPNFGVDFKVYLKNKNEHFTILKAIYESNRTGKIYGFQTINGNSSNKLNLVRNGLNKGWSILDFPQGEVKSDNGVVYNIKKLEENIKKKKNQIKTRDELLGINTYDEKAEKAEKDSLDDLDFKL
jgi:hypothetical protein